MQKIKLMSREQHTRVSELSHRFLATRSAVRPSRAETHKDAERCLVYAARFCETEAVLQCERSTSVASLALQGMVLVPGP